MNMRDVGFDLRNALKHFETEWRGREIEETRSINYAHAAAVLSVRCAIQTRHKRGDVMSARGLRLTQYADVILDSADDGKIIFIDVENFHP